MLLTVGTTEAVEAIAEAQENLQEVAKNPGILRTYFQNLVPDLLNFALQVVIAVIVYAVGAKLIGLIVKIVRKTMERRNADVGVIQFLSAVVKYALYFILILTILSLFGIATTSAVAVLGSCGVAVGLALQGSLSNFAGGVLILLLKPFVVGDYIIEGSNEGTVYEISVFYTKLKTVDNKMIVIPNGNLSNSSLVNVSHMDKRRVDIVVGIGYEADIRTAKNILYEIGRNDPARLPEEDVVVFVDNLGASSVDLGIRIWVKTSDYWDTKWRLMENIKYALDENHISIPYQQIDVQIDEKQMLVCDGDWLTEAIINLLKNASDYSGEQTTIHIWTEDNPMYTRIYVKDEGCGIAESELKNIFKRFYRINKEVNPIRVGIGLSLTKSIVEGMGGKISVRSELGCYTQFILTFVHT